MNDKYIASFFKGIDLKDKSILDVGCGSGRILKYVLDNNARYCEGIEPFTQTPNVNSHGHIVKINRIKFQEYNTHNKFDIIVLHDSINHLDEKACISLHRSRLSEIKYNSMFDKLYSILNSGGKLIIADASPENFWNDIHIKNPFDSSIEWHKHQQPGLWIKLLSDCGFVNPEVNWLTPQKLLVFDKLIGNKFVSYFLVSHFRLVMEK